MTAVMSIIATLTAVGTWATSDRSPTETLLCLVVLCLANLPGRP